MPRPRRRVPPPAVRRRDRHGRGARGPVTGPHLPILYNRIDLFDFTVATTVEYLRDLWPDELESVRFEIAAVPSPPFGLGEDGVERWHVDPLARRVVLFRVPVQRLGHLEREDPLRRRMYVEGCVFRAVAELLGCDPWDLAPGRFWRF